MTLSFPYEKAPPIGAAACLGLVVLSTDETIEQDMAQMLRAPDQALYVSRVEAGADVTPETLRAMGARLTAAAGLLPSSLPFDVIGYGCTSGSSVIGADIVHDAIRAGRACSHVTDPLTALIAACRGLSVRRLAVMSPYIDSVNEMLFQALSRAGIEVVGAGSFNVAEEAEVARIDPRSTYDAARRVAETVESDALFLSCTNLRSLSVIEALETALDLPVLSSNQVLAWHMAELAGIAVELVGGLKTVRPG